MTESTQPRKTTAGGLLRRIAGLCALLLLVIGLGESLGRVWMHAKYGVAGKTYGRWRGDPALGSRLGENRYDHRWRTNNLGFRNDEDVIEPRRGLRILAYGGSTTLCWNLPTAETWPALLQNRLRAATGNPGHQVLNAGDILWPINRILARARTELPALKPDVVLIMAGVNEVPNARLLASEGRPLDRLVPAGQFGAFSKKLPQDYWLARNSILYGVFHKIVLLPLVRRWHVWTHEPWSQSMVTDIGPGHPALAPDRDTLENYLHGLEDLIQACRAVGAEPVFIEEACGRHTVGLDHMVSYSRAGAEKARALNVPVVDAPAMVASTRGDPMDLFYESGIHYSQRGAALLAQTIYDQVFARSDLVSPATHPGGGAEFIFPSLVPSTKEFGPTDPTRLQGLSDPKPESP